MVTHKKRSAPCWRFQSTGNKEIDIVAGGIRLEASHVANDHRLLEGWREDDTCHHYKPCILALLTPGEINVHGIKSQEISFVLRDA